MSLKKVSLRNLIEIVITMMSTQKSKILTNINQFTITLKSIYGNVI